MNIIKHSQTAVYPQTGTPVIACFGDSVTHGAFNSVQGQIAGCEFDFSAVYHNRLRERLLTVNSWLPVSMINAGVAGDRARTALSRLNRDVISRRPDLCIVNFALNDVNDPLDVYISSLETIFDRLAEAGIDTVLMTPNMLNTYVHPDTIPMYREYAAVTAEYQNSGCVDTYVNAARSLAYEKSIPIADAYARWKQMQVDGTDITLCFANYINHPTRELHSIFTDALWRALADMA